LRAVWFLIGALWLAFTVPLALGQRTLLARDVFTGALHLKLFGAEQLRHGHIPALDPDTGLGQPFRGNPNAVAFYPGNLLYLALPFWSAFNLHFVLHWLLALFAMRALAREALQLGCARFWWQVLDWNTPSIRFYESLGAEVVKQWLTCRVEGESLRALGGESPPAAPSDDSKHRGL